jgi:LysR family transcriptional regulator, chromosome initiation inhibitor
VLLFIGQGQMMESMHRKDRELRLDAHQLAALAAVIDRGSFDAAAEHLHVTPSAVSQRIKSLEQRVGQVLVIREKPCRATAAGVPLLRLAAQSAMLEAEAVAEATGEQAHLTRAAIAVNADSMSAWFTAVFDDLPEVLFDIRIEDQDHSARLLREGVVMGAVSTERTPVPGCRVYRLGVMRYVAVASPAYVARYLPEGFSVASAVAAPSMAWNRADRLQDALLRKAFRRAISRPVHYVPTAEGFTAAVRAGLGWGMFPERQAGSGLRDGSLLLVTDHHLDVPLFWQCWNIDSTLIASITDAVRAAARNRRGIDLTDERGTVRNR